MTVAETKKQDYHYDHTACHIGYTRVAERGIGVPYNGRFGIGYVVPLVVCTVTVEVCELKQAKPPQAKEIER